MIDDMDDWDADNYEATAAGWHPSPMESRVGDLLAAMLSQLTVWLLWLRHYRARGSAGTAS